MSITSQRERLFDLLADRALVGLDPAEQEELARLLVAFPDAEAIALDIELAAAAVAVAAASEHGPERMPRSLAARIEELAPDGVPTNVRRAPDPITGSAAATGVEDEPPTAQRPKAMNQTLQMPTRPNQPAVVPAPLTKTLVHPQAATGLPQGGPPPASSLRPSPPSAAPVSSPSQVPGAGPPAMPMPGHVIPFRPAATTETQAGNTGSARFLMAAGWVAAAACLLLAIGAWYFRPRTQIVTVDVPTPPTTVTTTTPVPVPPLAPTPEQEREALLARAGTARLEWSKNPKDPASKEASGDVVWNAAEQRGYMRFRGLAKNDRRTNVYQLWIFDKARDDKYPVDGGVFDVDDEAGDVVVPIQAKLPVGEVALFAVTVEKPGGVVVSKRERIVVTAKPAS